MENELVQKELKKKGRNTIISAIILIIGIAILGFGYVSAKNAEDNPKDYTEFGWNNDTTDELVYLDITYDPIQLTEEIDGEAYYVLMDNDYYYIALMRVDKAESNKAPARIKGITALPESDVKTIAIDTFKEVFEDESILYSDYDGIFGYTIMDTTYSFFDLGFAYFFLGIVAVISGGIAVIINISNNNKFRKSISDIKLLNPTLYEKIINQMNASSKYYKELSLVATDDFLVSLNSNQFVAIDYKDMIWIYKYEYRYNGAKTNENLKVETKDGIIHDVAIASGGLKSKDKYYEEIMHTVMEKNKKVLVGYTQDNLNLANSMVNK